MSEKLGQAEHPVAVIGAGPTGLAAAAHLLARGVRPLVLEAGDSVGTGISSWDHIRLFSPWAMNIDAAARELLDATNWTAPPEDDYPTGRQLVERYLQPLAQAPVLAPHVQLSRRVLAVSRLGFDKLRSEGREKAPFELVAAGPNGVERHLARAVIDATGSVANPNPLGAGGIPAVGERELASHIAYGHPDLLGADRALHAGRRVLVAGSGHSAFGALLDLLLLREERPDTEVLWAVRRQSISEYFGEAGADQLPQRGRLAMRVAARIDELDIYTGFAADRLEKRAAGIVVSDRTKELPPVDRVIAATGYRPDLSLLRELRIALNHTLESPPRLAPLIDPDLHSCGTVPPHGADELSHPEAGVYVLGMKSYGRAPTFLMKTGYGQVQSVAATLAGDAEAAREAQAPPSNTGSCSTNGDARCCPAPRAETVPAAATAGGGSCRC